jgi:hypothetical protein
MPRPYGNTSSLNVTLVVFWVVCPPGWIPRDVFPYTGKVFFVPDDVLIIAALPN